MERMAACIAMDGDIMERMGACVAMDGVTAAVLFCRPAIYGGLSCHVSACPFRMIGVPECHARMPGVPLRQISTHKYGVTAS